jgi:hypothetical protein
LEIGIDHPEPLRASITDRAQREKIPKELIRFWERVADHDDVLRFA